MARQDKKAYELTDAEQRDLVALIQQGKTIPEKYRFILFEEKREVELVWNGKTRDVCTTVLPFQTLEHIDEPRTETKVQEDLFDSRGRQLRGWTNKLIWGDNKLILSSLKAGALRKQIEDAGGLKLIVNDLSKFAIHTTRKRLIGVQRAKKDIGQNFRAFEVLNVGHYERQAYLNVGKRLTEKQRAQAIAQKEKEFRELILRAYKAVSYCGDSAQTQDGFFHGVRNRRLIVIGPINLPVSRPFVEEIITTCRKRGVFRIDVLAFEFEMGLFPALREEAKIKGIDLAPKYIPAEVFDKRAVDKGQVIFHDISFVEATPHYDKKK